MASIPWLPFQLGLLVVLHSIFALFRLVHVLSHLALICRQAIRPLQDPTSTSASIDQDCKRWNKTPKHLAVILIPGIELRSWVWPSRADNHTRELNRLTRELANLVGWAKTLGLSSLSVYDRRGLLATHPNSLDPALFATTGSALTHSPGCATFTFPVSKSRARTLSDAPVNEVDSGHGGSDDVELDAGTATPPTDGAGAKVATMTVHLLSREAGRPRMAQVARELAVEQLGGKSVGPGDKGGVSVEVVGERIDGTLRPARDSLGLGRSASHRAPPRHLHAQHAADYSFNLL